MNLPDAFPPRAVVTGLGESGLRMLDQVRRQLFLEAGLQPTALTQLDWLALDGTEALSRRGDLGADALLGHDLQLPRASRITAFPAPSREVNDAPAATAAG